MCACVCLCVTVVTSMKVCVRKYPCVCVWLYVCWCTCLPSDPCVWVSVCVCVSVRRRGQDENKRMAYLIDLHTISILDMVQGDTVATINHDAKISNLMLNETGRKLMFRDKRHQLHLYDIESHEKTTILNYCSFNEWVPGSDVIVAQNRGNLCIWYNINEPGQFNTLPIKGEIEG